MALELAATAAGVAGLAGLSIQLMDTALKIQHTCSEAKAAPEVVSNLVFDLQTTSLLLGRLRLLHEKSAGADPLLDRFMVACFYRIPKVKKLADVLEDKFKRYGKIKRSLYAALRESDIESLGDDLRELQRTVRDALALFALSQNGRQDDALQSLVSGQAEIISLVQSSAVTITTTDRMSPNASSPAAARASGRRSPQEPTTTTPEDEESADEEITREPADSRGSSQASTQEVQQPRRERIKKRPPWFRARVALPTWMCRTVWDIAMHRSSYGWNINLATWHVVPDGSDIFKACKGSDVAAVRKLLDNGDASILDVNMYGWTLLDVSEIRNIESYCNISRLTFCKVAALWGDEEVLRFLLEQESWPDKTAVVKNAIKFAVDDVVDSRTPNCRYLLSDPLFDLDAPGLWICFRQSLEWGMRNGQSLLTLEEKLEMSWNLPEDVHQPSSEFLYWVGMSADDPTLAFCRDSHGRHILHYAARHLRPSIYSDDGIDKGWLEIGQNAIRRNAHLALDDFGTTTPLHRFLSFSIQGADITGATVMDTLRRWLAMMQQGGADLGTYGQYEKTRFDAQGYQQVQPRQPWRNRSISRFKIELEVGPSIEDWGLGVYWVQSHEIYQRRGPPGSFYEPSAIPTHIWWSPWYEEDSEDLWEYKTQRIPFTIYRRITDLDTNTCEIPDSPFDKLMNESQDDTGAIMMMVMKRPSSHERPPRRRSTSQPASLRHRDADDLCYREDKNRKWLSGYRFCPICQRWKMTLPIEPYRNSNSNSNSRFYNLSSDIDESNFQDIRRCARGQPHPALMLDKKGFLAEVTYCCLVFQGKGHSWRLSERHTGQSDCPVGCGKIKWDKLRIPEGLEPMHYDVLFEK